MFDNSVRNMLPVQSWKNRELFCYNLPSKPQPGIGKVLVTGASGYVGGRLVPELVARGYEVRVMVRAASPEYKELWPDAEIVVADALETNRLKIALEDIDTAYYLIHSLLLGPKEFVSAERQAAINFREAAAEKQIKRIIYLGGLGDIRTTLSSHLQSRIQVAEELRRGKVPVTILRAAIIVGSGSASYEIIKHLVKNLYVLPIPRWARTKCQPIGIRDVIKYLVGVMETPESSGKSFDIGGSDILTYQKMLEKHAEILGKKRLFIPARFSNIQFYSYIASLLTPVPAAITRALMEGLKNEVICHDKTIKKFLPFKPLTYREAILKAMSREEQDNVHTRWTGAYPPAHELALKLHELDGVPKYTHIYTLISHKKTSSLFQSICKIGGKEGWLSNNWMWRLRGWVDKIVLGVGTSRGRRSQTSLKINDVIDFWRVEDLQPNRRLLLRAEMKIPGKAWLEFNINEERSITRLSVIPYYHTRSIFGKIYWFVFLPLHQFIYNDLIKQIERRS